MFNEDTNKETSTWPRTKSGQDFIKALTKKVVTKVAAEELPLFDELVQEYLDDPTPPNFDTITNDDPLGIGLGEFVVAVTPAVMAAIQALFTSQHQQNDDTIDNPKETMQAISPWLNQNTVHTYYIFSFDIGFQRLFTKMGNRHPRSAEARDYETKLKENLRHIIGESKGKYELEKEREQVLEQLNTLSLDVLGHSFIKMCQVDEPTIWTQWQDWLEQNDWDSPVKTSQIQQVHRAIAVSIQIAEKYGIALDDAILMANIIMNQLANYSQNGK